VTRSELTERPSSRLHSATKAMCPPAGVDYG
jgi:hypothetical protein